MSKNSNHLSKTFSFYWAHIRQYPALYIPAAMLIPITTLVGSYIPPLILATILNRLSNHQYQAHHVWSSFGGDLILYLIVSLISGVALWRIFDQFYWRLEGQVNRSIAKQVFNYLMHQGADFHANRFAGSLVSDTNKLMSSYIRLTDTISFQTAPMIIGLIFVSVVMFKKSALYTIILLVFCLLYISFSFLATRRVRETSKEQAAAESQQTGMLADAITNVLAIKSFAREKYENQRFAKAADNTYSKLIDIMHAGQKQHLFLSSTTGLMSWLALLAAIISVVTFGANIATAFLIFNYTSSIVSQLFQFSNNSLRNYNRVIGDSGEMINTLEIPFDVEDPEKPEKLTIKSGEIEFQNVTFTHNGAQDSIFEDFSIQINSGEKIGLVGHSGSGKSTFTRLLLRFSDIDSGEILIDGQNIARITQSDLHSQIAYVPQEPLLFHRSIRENIAYGQSSSSLTDIVDAARKAHAQEFIDLLPDQYETLVGERGVKLSGGQRQRIAIARAMLKNAPILLLDEATSALDSESEVLIQDALWKLMEGRTAIVIAHRLSTIQKMDRIIVMDDGQIVEQGTHKELLAKNGQYAKLWAHQSGGFLEE